MIDESMVLVYSEEGRKFHLRTEGRTPLCDPQREVGMLTTRRSVEATGATVCHDCEAFVARMDNGGVRRV